MKLFFAGSMRGGGGYIKVYRRIITLLNNHGAVISEFLNDNSRHLEKEGKKGDLTIYARTSEAIRHADLLVGCSHPSIGVGYEIGMAESLGIPIVVLYLVARNIAFRQWSPAMKRSQLSPTTRSKNSAHYWKSIWHPTAPDPRKPRPLPDTVLRQSPNTSLKNETEYPCHTRLACQSPGLTGGEMILFPCPLLFLMQKHCLNEEIIGTGGKLPDPQNILRTVDHIGHIGDFLPRNDPHYFLFEKFKIQKALLNNTVFPPPDPKRNLIRVTTQYGCLQFSQPRTNREPQFLEPILHDIHMIFLFQGEGETGNSVIEDNGTNSKGIIIQQHTVHGW